MERGPRWELFPHGADVGIRGEGATVEEAFAAVPLALTAVVTDVERVEDREERTVECAAEKLDDLFFDFVDELVFLMSTEHLLFSGAEVHIGSGRLTARVRGERVDRVRHEPAVEVKGPTYTALRVAVDPATGRWVAECVVDV